MIGFRLFLSAGVTGICAMRVVAGPDLPLVSGNFQIAQQFLHGDAHVLLMGDSIQNRLIGDYAGRLQIDHWSGVTTGANYGEVPGGDSGASVFYAFQQPFVVGNTTGYQSDSPPSSAVAGATPGTAAIATFSGTTVASYDPANPLGGRFYETGITGNQAETFDGGAWATGHMHAQVLYYANPAGLASGVRFNVRSDENVILGSAALNGYAATGHIASATVDFEATGAPLANNFAGSFSLVGGTTPAAGSNFTILGVRYYTDTPGFQLTNIAWGGRGIDYFINGATDTNLKASVTLTDNNIALIWIGQNDQSKYTPAQWKLKMQELIARYKAARADMKFILVSSYDTANSSLPGYAQDLYEISQEDSSVLFLNLFKAAGDFASLTTDDSGGFAHPKYLDDGVHPSTAGVPYFADQLNGLLETAATQVPEPSMLPLAGLGLVVLLGTRRRVHRNGVRPAA